MSPLSEKSVPTETPEKEQSLSSSQQSCAEVKSVILAGPHLYEIITFGTFVSRPNSSLKDKAIIYLLTSFFMCQITQLCKTNLDVQVGSREWGPVSGAKAVFGQENVQE